MQNKSWEIVVAGLLLLVVAIVITSNKSDSNQEYEKQAEYTISVNNQDTESSSIKVIDLKELEKLEELKQLESLSALESLESLKSLSGLVPQEAREKLVTEINKAIAELEGDTSVSVSFDLEDGLVLLHKNYELVPGQWSKISPGVYAYSKEFDASGLKRSTISIPAGSITIVGTNNPKAELLVEASGQIKSSDELDKYISISSAIDDTDAVFSFESLVDESKSNIQLQATLSVPSNMEIYSVTKAGHISSTNIIGDQSYKTLGGHIELESLDGEIAAITEGGHISISESSGVIILESLGGHLNVEECEGDITLKTAGGNIGIDKTSGVLNARTGGGNIDIDIVKSTGEIDAKTSAGTVNLHIPTSTNANIILSGTSTRLDKAFTFEGSRKKGEILGKIGGGGVQYTLRTSFGAVNVTKND